MTIVPHPTSPGPAQADQDEVWQQGHGRGYGGPGHRWHEGHPCKCVKTLECAPLSLCHSSLTDGLPYTGHAVGDILSRPRGGHPLPRAHHPRAAGKTLHALPHPPSPPLHNSTDPLHITCRRSCPEPQAALSPFLKASSGSCLPTRCGLLQEVPDLPAAARQRLPSNLTIVDPRLCRCPQWSRPGQ